jgi:hypothetical protein
MDTNYRFAGDREFLIRAALAGVRPVSIPMSLYHYREHAGSATVSAEDSREARRGAQRLLVIGEEIGLLEKFLDRSDVPAEAHGSLRSAHGAACYRGAATALYHRRLRLAAHAIRQGFRYDMMWPLEFTGRAWHRVLQEFGLRERI